MSYKEDEELREDEREDEKLLLRSLCPGCRGSMTSFRKNLKEYMGQMQYGNEFRVCQNKKCSFFVPVKGMDWTESKKIKAPKIVDGRLNKPKFRFKEWKKIGSKK